MGLCTNGQPSFAQHHLKSRVTFKFDAKAHADHLSRQARNPLLIKGTVDRFSNQRIVV